MYYTKKGGFMQPTFNIRFAMHATNSLTGNWKPGGRESHPHQRHLRDAVNSNRVIFDSTSISFKSFQD